MAKLLIVPLFVASLATPSLAQDSCSPGRKELDRVLDRRIEVTNGWDTKAGSCSDVNYFSTKILLIQHSMDLLSNLKDEGCASEKQIANQRRELSDNEDSLKEAQEQCRIDKAEIEKASSKRSPPALAPPALAGSGTFVPAAPTTNSKPSPAPAQRSTRAAAPAGNRSTITSRDMGDKPRDDSVSDKAAIAK